MLPREAAQDANGAMQASYIYAKQRYSDSTKRIHQRDGEAARSLQKAEIISFLSASHQV